MKTFSATFKTQAKAQAAYEIAKREYEMLAPTINGLIVTTTSDTHDADEITIDWDDAGIRDNDYTWRYA